MLTGSERQQRWRMLAEETVAERLRLVRGLVDFAESHLWTWTPGGVEDLTVSLTSGEGRCARSAIRGYHLTLRILVTT